MGEAEAARSLKLPPGFHFQPTDEQLILHFLYPKANSLLPTHPDIIPELDLSSYDPWEFRGKALSSGSNQWYFFSKMRETRDTKKGHWKQLDSEDLIFDGCKRKVGRKKYFVFCIGEALDGGEREISWVMQEYHLSNSTLLFSNNTNSPYKSQKHPNIDCGKWVLCRVHEMKNHCRQRGIGCNNDYDEDEDGTELSCLDEIFLSLDDDLDDIFSN